MVKPKVQVRSLNSRAWRAGSRIELIREDAADVRSEREVRPGDDGILLEFEGVEVELEGRKIKISRKINKRSATAPTSRPKTKIVSTGGNERARTQSVRNIAK